MCFYMFTKFFIPVFIGNREKPMAPHSSTLAWKIPWTEEPSGLQSRGSTVQSTEWLHFHFSLSTFMHWRRKWQPTPVFLLGESQGWGSLVGCRLWGQVAQSRTRLKWLSSSSSNIGNSWFLISAFAFHLLKYSLGWSIWENMTSYTF